MSFMYDGRRYWVGHFVMQEHVVAAKVSNFPHAPFASQFNNIARVGLILEAAYTEAHKNPAYWFARVLKVQGYLVQLRWIGMEDNYTRDFWGNFAGFRPPAPNRGDARLHHVGFTRENNLPLRPPTFIQRMRPDWEDLIEEQMHSPDRHMESIHNAVEQENQCQVAMRTLVEAVDMENKTALRRGRIEQVVGRRMRVKYLEDHSNKVPCWVHEDDTSAYMIPALANVPRPNLHPEFRIAGIGLKLELVDPTRPYFIVPGTILEIREDQHYIVGIDGTNVYARIHAGSPLLLPAGYCSRNKLFVHYQKPTEDYSYENYRSVPESYLCRRIPQHDLDYGQVLEAVAEHLTPKVCSARVLNICGALVLLRYHGDTIQMTGWTYIESKDLYPVGWADLVGHPLQSPYSANRLRIYDQLHGP